MKNYDLFNIGNSKRIMLHDKLNLTGAEISITTIEADEFVSFVHSHTNNEEIYGVINGKGKVVIDGEDINLISGDWIRISPKAKRQFFAAKDSSITYVCIQVKENSLEALNNEDGIVY